MEKADIVDRMAGVMERLFQSNLVPGEAVLEAVRNAQVSQNITSTIHDEHIDKVRGKYFNDLQAQQADPFGGAMQAAAETGMQPQEAPIDEETLQQVPEAQQLMEQQQQEQQQLAQVQEQEQQELAQQQEADAQQLLEEQNAEMMELLQQAGIDTSQMEQQSEWQQQESEVQDPYSDPQQQYSGDEPDPDEEPYPDEQQQQQAYLQQQQQAEPEDDEQMTQDDDNRFVFDNRYSHLIRRRRAKRHATKQR